MTTEISTYDMHNFVRVLHDDGSWDALIKNWREQCERLDEDFDNYAGATLDIVEPLSKHMEQRAALFALKYKNEHVAICQVNTAMLPRHDGPVMRVRFITLSPDYDLTNKSVRDYGEILISLLFQVVKLAIVNPDFESNEIKFHLRSPSDINFFSALSHGLNQESTFHSVQMSGAWLYITRK